MRSSPSTSRTAASSPRSSSQRAGVLEDLAADRVLEAEENAAQAEQRACAPRRVAERVVRPCRCLEPLPGLLEQPAREEVLGGAESARRLGDALCRRNDGDDLTLVSNGRKRTKLVSRHAPSLGTGNGPAQPAQTQIRHVKIGREDPDPRRVIRATEEEESRSRGDAEPTRRGLASPPRWTLVAPGRTRKAGFTQIRWGDSIPPCGGPSSLHCLATHRTSRPPRRR